MSFAERVREWRRLAAILAVVGVGCGTLATPAGDDDAVRPNARAGPFRPLVAEEVRGTAPNVLARDKERPYTGVTALDLDGGPGAGATALYVTCEISGVRGVYRFVALDGRSFGRTPDPPTAVLVASETWEGGRVEAPQITRVGGELRLYYSGAGGIGVARSRDGIVFDKLPSPVFVGGASWASEPPRAPGVIELGSDDVRLFYASGGALGEARSRDGLGFAPIGDAPILMPSDEPEAFDDAGLDDPEPVRAVGAEGRTVLRVYYTGKSALGLSSIGLAARFGSEGALTRAVGPAFGESRGPVSPAVLVRPSYSLLYVSRDAGVSNNLRYRVIAAGIAPGDVRLPPPVEP